jgi:tRNA(Ser,Leu) C12 N-acetylase TAN1
VKEKKISVITQKKIAISILKDNNENYYNIKKKKPVLRSVVHDQQA